MLLNAKLVTFVKSKQCHFQYAYWAGFGCIILNVRARDKKRRRKTVMGKYIELTDANFNESISQGVTLVDFWAPWCGPCRMVAPVIEGLADEYAGKAKIAKINVDDNQQTAMKFRVMSIPTVIVFKDGEVSEVMVGADMRGDKYRNMLNKAVPASVAASA
jgi:thioredoxin 1